MTLRKSLKSLTVIFFAIILIVSNSMTAFAGIPLTRDRYNEGQKERDDRPENSGGMETGQTFQLRKDDKYVYWDAVEDVKKYELKFYIFKDGREKYVDKTTTTNNYYKLAQIKNVLKNNGYYGSISYFLKITPIFKDGEGNERKSNTLEIYVASSSSSSSSATVSGGPAYSSNAGYVWSGGTGAWYLWNNGKKAIGWHFVNGYWYYMYSDGKMATGWFTEGNYTYYLNPSTSASVPEGAMVTGNWRVDGVQHYFNPNSGGPQGSMEW